MAAFKRIDYLGPFMLLFVLVSLVLSLLSLGVFYIEQSRVQGETDREKGAHELALKQQLFMYALEHYEGLLQVVLGNRFFTSYLVEASGAHYADASDFFDSIARSDRQVMQLRYLDETGQEQIRVERRAFGEAPLLVGRTELQMKAHRDYFIDANGLDEGQLYVSKLDLNIEHGRIEMPYRPVLRFALPVFSEGVRRGIIIVNVFMQRLLDELVASQRFNIYLYDAQRCLLYSSDPSMPPWMRYVGKECRFDPDSLLLQTSLRSMGGAEALSLGIAQQEVGGWHFGYFSRLLMILALVILPLSLVLAYVLARIPRRLYNQLEQQHKILLQQSKLAAMGEMIGAIAHQWRQPLNAVGVLTQELRLKLERGLLEREEGRKLTDEVQHYLEYMSQTIEDFRNFFKPSKQKSPFDVLGAVEASLGIVRQQFEDHGIGLHVGTAGASFVVEGYENEFKQVVVNILNNAREAIATHASDSVAAEHRVDIVVERRAAEVAVRIRDTGGGIAETVIDTVFDPYVSTKYAQQGTGIGLYLAKTIIERSMKGELRARNTGEGAEFEIVLPAAVDGEFSPHLPRVP